jgi:hypothetical protein
MATQRPLKEGSVRTYQEKVALGFPDILASEMDADLDTIYAAWNGGVATANLNDASVTEAKLAPDAHLWTAATGVLKPVNATMPPTLAVSTGDNLVWGTRTAKARLAAHPTTPAAYWYFNRNFAGTLDDATIASWVADFDSDVFRIGRAAPGVTSMATLLLLDATGTAQFGVRANVAPATTYAEFAGNPTLSGGYDSAQPTVLARCNYGGDAFEVWRRAPSGGAWTSPLVVRGSDGKTVCTLADGSIARGMIGVGQSVRALADFPVDPTWTLPSKNAWNVFTTGVYAAVGGFALLLVDPAWMYSAASSTGTGAWVQVLIDGTTVVYQRLYRAAASMAVVPMPGFACFPSLPAGSRTIQVRVFCETNASVQMSADGAQVNAGTIRLIEFC